MVSMGRCLLAVLLLFPLAACKKADGTATGPSGGGAAGGDQPAGDQPAAGGDPAERAPAASGPMGPAEFCRAFGDKAEKEGGKAADFFQRNYGKDCVKRLTAEKKKKGDEKWNEFVSCAQAEATAADAFDTCEL